MVTPESVYFSFWILTQRSDYTERRLGRDCNPIFMQSYVAFPGPHKARPGFAPVCSPSLRTCTPLTKT